MHIVVLRDVRLQRLRELRPDHPALQMRHLVLQLLLVARIAVLGEDHRELSGHVREKECAERHADRGNPLFAGCLRGN